MMSADAVRALAGLSQRTWRDFGMTTRPATAAADDHRLASAAADMVGSRS
jgi:hypothetical protein